MTDAFRPFGLFVQSVAGSLPYIVTSDDRPEKLVDWDGISQVKQPTAGSGLFFAIRASRRDRYAEEQI